MYPITEGKKKYGYIGELANRHKKWWDCQIMDVFHALSMHLECNETSTDDVLKVEDLWWIAYDWSRYTTTNINNNVENDVHVSGSLRECILCSNNLEHV